MNTIKDQMSDVPLLLPYEPAEFWERVRQIVREEIKAALKNSETSVSLVTPGLTYKPLYKMDEVCKIFSVTRPTIYEWMRQGKLKPVKISTRVYFLWQEIDRLMKFDEG